MEFIAEVQVPVTPAELVRNISIESLPDWCASIERVLSCDGELGRIFCVWGTFEVRRQVMKDGVRFFLPGCPNKLQWSISTGGGRDPRKLLIRCSMDSAQTDPDFVASLEQFVSNWQNGLRSGLPALV